MYFIKCTNYIPSIFVTFECKEILKVQIFKYFVSITHNQCSAITISMNYSLAN